MAKLASMITLPVTWQVIQFCPQFKFVIMKNQWYWTDYLFPSTLLSIYQIWLYWSLAIMKNFHYQWTKLYFVLRRLHIALVFCAMFCLSLFVLFLFAIVLSVPWLTSSEYPFGIFKLFLCYWQSRSLKSIEVDFILLFCSILDPEVSNLVCVRKRTYFTNKIEKWETIDSGVKVLIITIFELYVLKLPFCHS